jgi:tRNA-(ms[2]io[6]A)-hydroxylase
MLDLRATTSSRWVEVVLDNFDEFLLDHAACERKASANAIALVTHYPDRRELVRVMIELAREELDHFQRVHRLIDERGLMLTRDRKDLYLRGLLAQVRSGREQYFLDRLLVAGIAEARGCERFALIAGALAKRADEPELTPFYEDLSRSEARHCHLFVDLAETYFAQATVSARLGELLEHEARVLSGLPIGPALH